MELHVLAGHAERLRCVELLQRRARERDERDRVVRVALLALLSPRQHLWHEPRNAKDSAHLIRKCFSTSDEWSARNVSRMIVDIWSTSLGFVHSQLDATHRMLNALEYRAQGLTFASVHHSY